MASEGQTLGKAIDQILHALDGLDDASRETALVAVCRQLQIGLGQGLPAQPILVEPPSGVADVIKAQPATVASPPATPAKRIDIRSFKEEKNPSSARQMACVVAFYLRELAPEAEQKETINTSDLEKYFKQAGFRLPVKISQILIDAKASGYFDSPARSEYKLNAVGHNLVAHGLPERQA